MLDYSKLIIIFIIIIIISLLHIKFVCIYYDIIVRNFGNIFGTFSMALEFFFPIFHLCILPMLKFCSRTSIFSLILNCMELYGIYENHHIKSGYIDRIFSIHWTHRRYRYQQKRTYESSKYIREQSNMIRSPNIFLTRRAYEKKIILRTIIQWITILLLKGEGWNIMIIWCIRSDSFLSLMNSYRKFWKSSLLYIERAEKILISPKQI